METAFAHRGRPTVVLATTFMGRGVSFMEDDYRWHGVPPSIEQGRQALGELPPTRFGDFHRFAWEDAPSGVTA
jgi:transketolase